MSYVAPYIDDSGIHVNSYDDILQNKISKYKEIYGNDIYLDNDSQDYQFLSAMSLNQYDLEQFLVYIYNNRSPAYAVGASLDTLCSINGIFRKANTHSVAVLTLTGTANAELSYPVAVDINGNSWQMDASVILDSAGNATAEAICSTPGQIQAPVGTINAPYQSQTGWYSVTNENSAIPGTPVETDSELKQRRQLAVSLPSLSVFDGICANVSRLEGVQRARGYENDTGNTSSQGFPPHSIALVVEGGDSQAVASAIYLRKTPGTATYGSESVSVVSTQGVSNTIKFSRPTEISLQIAITIINLNNYTDAIGQKIKDNLMSYIKKFDIGDSLYVSNLNGAILSANEDISNPSFTVSSIAVNSQSVMLAINWNEVVTCIESNITITITS